MLLPGRLRTTSLGDLLGTLHRAGSTGTLELAEARGRTHRVHVRDGCVTAVELDGASAPLAELLRRADAVDEDVLRRSLLRAMASRRLLGEVLVHDFHLAQSVVGEALRAQLRLRLEALERLTDAQILFRVVVRPPRGALTDAPLGPAEFLRGRRRARDRRPHGDEPTRPIAPPQDAWRVLGVPPGADTVEVKRAYRRLARETHPDLHPHASPDERRELAARFQRVTEAYRRLVA